MKLQLRFLTALLLISSLYFCKKEPENQKMPAEPMNGSKADTIAPREVTELAVKNGDYAVQLSWKDPSNADLDSIEISWDTTKIRVGRGIETKEIKYLTNLRSHIFKVKTIDTVGNFSKGVEICGMTLKQTIEFHQLNGVTLDDTTGFDIDGDGIKDFKPNKSNGTEWQGRNVINWYIHDIHGFGRNKLCSAKYSELLREDCCIQPYSKDEIITDKISKSYFWINGLQWASRCGCSLPTDSVYIGIQLKRGNNFHFGWMLINNKIILESGINTKPNTPIRAGEK